MAKIKEQNIKGDNQQFADNITNKSQINGNVTVNDADGNINQAGRDIVSIINNYSIPKKILFAISVLLVILIMVLIIWRGTSNSIQNATINAPVIQGNNINVQYGIPQKALDNLNELLEIKKVEIQKRDGIIQDWVKKYKELESQLVSRSDETAKQAKVFLEQGRLEDAERLFVQALENDLKTVQTANLKAAENASSLAKIKVLQLDYSTAKTYYQQAVQFAPDNPLYLNNLAYHLYTLGEYAEAEPLYLRSLAINKETLGEDHPNIATSLNNLAELYQAQGKYERAERLYLGSLSIRKKVLGEDHPDVAQSLNNLAKLYQVQDKYEKAEPLYFRSLGIREKLLGKDHPDVAQSLNNLAGLYQIQGKYDKAELLYLRSLSIREKLLGKDHPDVAQSLNNLAKLYQMQGEYDKAEPLYLRSLTIWEKILGENHPDVATSLNNLAELYQVQGKYEQAESLYLRSLSIREKVLGKDHPDVAQSLNNLAGLYQIQGKYDKAEPLYLRSLTTLEKILGENHPDFANVLDNLAKLYFAEHRYEKAEILLQKSLRIMNNLLERWLYAASVETRQSYLQQQEFRRNYYLSFYGLRNLGEEAFYFSITRKGLLLQVASQISGLTKESQNPSIQKQIQEFKALRTQLAKLVFSNSHDRKTIQYLEEKSNALEMQLSQQITEYKLRKTEISPQDVLIKLSSQQVLVDFLIYKEIDFKTDNEKDGQVIALIADKENGIKLIKLGELASIAETIETYRSAIVPSIDNQFIRKKALPETAKVLYQQLWQPLTPYLENKKTVYLIPDGILHLLPFKALQDESGKYLAENYQLITLNSARDIVLPPLEGTSSQAAIFAAPNYGDANEANALIFPPLTNSLNEGQQINKLFLKKHPESPAKLFLKAQATEQAINTLTAPKILHISTHGFFLPIGKIKNPLTRSGLAFANANLGVKGFKQNDGTDGILTALEVLNLNLVGTELVTLSASDTNVGDIKNGEGVYSLSRAFQEAGAKAVLSTLWEVDDQASSEFMQKFYTRFLDGKSAQVAIQETQQEFMQDKKYNNPYYWAGFVMTGKE